jgi:NADH dehydrogenase FAD-containing subunit
VQRTHHLDSRFRRARAGPTSGLRTDALGRLLTDETLTSVDDDRIVAAGDAAAPSDQPLRMSCYAAGPLGARFWHAFRDLGRHGLLGE